MARAIDVVAFLKLFRFPLVFTAIADSAAGALLGRYLEPRWGVAALLGISSAGLYFFGVTQNDIVDREKDKGSAPERVLPSGRLSLRAASWAAGLALAGSLSAVLATGYPHLIQRLVLWTLAVLAICTYNLCLRFPPIMGLVRVFNLLLGVSAEVVLWSDAVKGWVLAVVSAPTFLYVSSLSYASTMKDGALDRSGLALAFGGMVFGALLAVSLSAQLTVGYAYGAAQDMIDLVQFAMRKWYGMLFATPLVSWLAWRAWKARDRKGVLQLTRDGVWGIILLDAALLGSDNGLVPALLITALLIPAAASVAIFKRLA